MRETGEKLTTSKLERFLANNVYIHTDCCSIDNIRHGIKKTFSFNLVKCKNIYILNSLFSTEFSDVRNVPQCSVFLMFKEPLMH